ncbi:MAG: M28 family peptidase [Chitinophagaceae bacterium]|nr:M28 family peptidase [Chitinophagaceae bacterium]
MKQLICLVLFVSVSFAYGQQKTNPKPFAKEISVEDLKTHLYILAGEEMQGRETATEGQRKAADYIENEFKRLGLLPGMSNVYQMPFPVYADSLLNASLAVNEQSFQPGVDFSVNIMAAHNASFRFSEAVFAGFGIVDSTRDDYNNLDARGKLVVVLSSKFADNLPADTKKRLNPYRQQEAAMGKGAAALLIIDKTVAPVIPKGNMYVNMYRNSFRINTFSITEKVAQAILGDGYSTAKGAALQNTTASGNYTANIDLDFTKTIVTMQSTNVLGLLEGTDLKDEYVVLTAHYDHLGMKNGKIWYGADDDGSGTVGILELAKAFTKAKAAGKGPRRSILFMTVSGEEKGLWGSDYYGDHPVFPLEKTTVNLNIDMIGRIDPSRKKGDSTNYVYIVGDDKLSSDLRPISEANNRKYVKLELDYKYNDPKDPERIYYRSDHYNFAKHGVPIIFYFNGLHADYHQPTDTPDKINYALLQKRTQLVFYTAWDMANRTAMLKRDIPLP